MPLRPKFEEFRRAADEGLSQKVRSAGSTKVVQRKAALDRAFSDPAAARSHAAAVKDHVLANLGPMLEEFERHALSRGMEVVWATNAKEANEAIERVCREAGPRGARVVKGKSMATEETGLNQFLEERGHHVVETDLGEFVVQLDGDHPSHIVTPIIHKDRHDSARALRRAGIAVPSDEPVAIAAAARSHLREEFARADVGVSGANFGIVETGRIVIVENEGNNRLSTTAPRVHVVLMGIEKLLPAERDLALFLPLLVGSATGQHLTVYTHLVGGPKGQGETDGPERVVVVLLDNGRSRVLHSPEREILRCLRCGACLNVCPVYREVSGHAYRHVYPGPLGAVLAPSLEGVEDYGDLAQASTLCGACHEACPVDIPIPDLLLGLRKQGTVQGSWSAWRRLAENDRIWRAALRLVPMAQRVAPGWREVHGLLDDHGAKAKEGRRGRP
ncbi:MAG: LUD domain-containing protein [Fimbriimonadaceae bacterium]